MTRLKVESLLLIRARLNKLVIQLALRHRKGRPGELRDTMIAGIVLASASGKITGCILSMS